MGSFCKHASWRKTKRNIGTNVKKGISIILNIIGMPRTINCLFFVAMEVLLPNWQMGWQERIEEGSSNLPQSYICCSKAVPCKNMKQSNQCMNSWQCQKKQETFGVIALVAQW